MLSQHVYKIKVENKNYTWFTNSEKIELIRKGLPYAAIDTISKRTKNICKPLSWFFGDCTNHLQ